MEPITKVDISRDEPPSYCGYVGAVESGRNLSAEDIRRDLEYKAKSMKANYVLLRARVAGSAFLCPSASDRATVCDPGCSPGAVCMGGVCVKRAW